MLQKRADAAPSTVPRIPHGTVCRSAPPFNEAIKLMFASSLDVLRPSTGSGRTLSHVEWVRLLGTVLSPSTAAQDSALSEIEGLSKAVRPRRRTFHKFGPHVTNSPCDRARAGCPPLFGNPAAILARRLFSSSALLPTSVLPSSREGPWLCVSGFPRICRFVSGLLNCLALNGSIPHPTRQAGEPMADRTFLGTIIIAEHAKRLYQSGQTARA